LLTSITTARKCLSGTNTLAYFAAEENRFTLMTSSGDWKFYFNLAGSELPLVPITEIEEVLSRVPSNQVKLGLKFGLFQPWPFPALAFPSLFF
jgi:hypothetical protein